MKESGGRCNFLDVSAQTATSEGRGRMNECSGDSAYEVECPSVARLAAMLVAGRRRRSERRNREKESWIAQKAIRDSSRDRIKLAAQYEQASLPFHQHRGQFHLQTLRHHILIGVNPASAHQPSLSCISNHPRLSSYSLSSPMQQLDQHEHSQTRLVMQLERQVPMKVRREQVEVQLASLQSSASFLASEVLSLSHPRSIASAAIE